ncbi:MAG TPA: PGPGW domain-containing protein [Gammaproteobacteria bacterium]|nr:PGPGW domain-containing protein [Gammaproteobacteria bacterium]
MIPNFLQAVEAHAGLLVAASVLTMLIGIVLVPALIIRVPEDYFLYEHRHAVSLRARHPLARLALTGAKNVIGALLLAAGVALLFLPGQGLLTLIAGLMIMNYPGKFEFERWLIRRPRVLPALNWLRRKYGRPPLKCP